MGIFIVKQSRQNILFLDKELEVGDVITYDSQYGCYMEVKNIVNVGDHCKTEVVFEKGSNALIPDNCLTPGAMWMKVCKKLKI